MELLETPWLVGMVLLFALEFIEGNTITRLYFMRMRRLTRAALAEGRLTPDLVKARAEQLASFTHFLDIPILVVIVSLGALRPSHWTQFAVGTLIAVMTASALNFFVPRLYPWTGEAASRALRPPETPPRVRRDRRPLTPHGFA